MGNDALAPTVGRIFARLARQVELGLAPLDLSLPQYRVLGFLSDGEAGSSRMAEKLAVSPPSITAVVDGLVAKGLVERRADPSDRRRLPLSLTDKGATVLAEADASVHERLDGVLAHAAAPAAKAARTGVVGWELALDAARDAKQGARS